jgi:hypothetical protein
MRLENAQADARLLDPRQRLCQTKYFGMRPQPLEQYLYRLQLPQTAERVFWIHWDAGCRNGDFLSEIPISVVASQACCDDSSVSRAYQRLRKAGLLRRQDPGRDPANPHRQATAVTEVLLPREALATLFRAPNRTPRGQRPPLTSPPAAPLPTKTAESVPNDSPGSPMPPAAAAPTRSTIYADCMARHGRNAMQIILGKLGPLETNRYHQAVRTAQGGADPGWAPERMELVDDLERAFLEAHLLSHLEQARSKPASTESPSTPSPGRPGPRQLAPYALARLRGRLSEILPTATVDEHVRQIAWSAERGALAKYDLAHAVNIAVKKVRESQWTRPHRMPPQWGRTLERHQPCGTA